MNIARFFIIVVMFYQVAGLAHSDNGTYAVGSTWSQFNSDNKAGYVMGVVDAYSIANKRINNNELFITNCVPKTVTSEQLVKVVDKYISNSPEQLHYNLDAIVAVSISNAFPCQNLK